MKPYALTIAGLAMCFSAACGSDESEPIELEHTFASLHLEAGEEIAEVCQSWTLNNEDYIFVNAVDMTAGLGFHHSNWYFVPDNVYEGPDGTWECSERGFNQAAAGVTGGVVFAQSTQVMEETMAFGAGVAIPIPPHSRVVGNVHLLNASDAAIDTDITLALRDIPRDEVEVWLAPMFLEYHALNIPPNSRSVFETECDFETEHQRQFQRPNDFSIYYILPHYHELGEGMGFVAKGGVNGERAIYDKQAAIGEPLGKVFDPPFSMQGSERIRFQCNFNNPRDEVVQWGVGDQEMCIFMGFTDSPLIWGGGINDSGTSGEMTMIDGVPHFERDCLLIAYPSSHFWEVTQ